MNGLRVRASAAAAGVGCLLGCAGAVPPAAVSIPAALPPPPPPVASRDTPDRGRERVEPSEEADFSSDQGLVHLRGDGAGRIVGSYPNGVLVCKNEAQRLECEWAEGMSEGRAVFVARGDGGYDGTWGSGPSATDGGAWVLTPISARAGSLDGVYDTNWGAATVRQTGAAVHVEYPRGTMGCRQLDARLDCAWTEGGNTGRAELAVEPGGVLRGRWGNGASSTDGGAWIFVKR